MHVISIVVTLTGLGAVLGPPRVIVAQDDLDPVLATLEGSWEGKGELLGRPATFVMTWEIALNGKFLPPPGTRRRSRASMSGLASLIRR